MAHNLQTKISEVFKQENRYTNSNKEFVEPVKRAVLVRMRVSRWAGGRTVWAADLN